MSEPVRLDPHDLAPSDLFEHMTPVRDPDLEPVQIFAEGSFVKGTLTWGWQCFRCCEEEAGFGNATTAGEGRDNHLCPIPPTPSRGTL